MRSRQGFRMQAAAGRPLPLAWNIALHLALWLAAACRRDDVTERLGRWAAQDDLLQWTRGRPPHDGW